jgi:hypothetical protein
MPIISSPGSVAQSQAFQASLSQLVQLQRIPKNFQILPNPLPLYSVELRDLMITGDASTAAKKVCWRYFANADSEDTIIAGDINMSTPPRVVRLSYGSPAWSSLQVASEPHPDVPQMNELRYEPLLLRVPGLYVEVYWMRLLAPTTAGIETGWVIPYHMFQREEGPQLARMYSMTAFNDQLLSYAGAQLDRSNRPGEAR